MATKNSSNSLMVSRALKKKDFARKNNRKPKRRDDRRKGERELGRLFGGG